jgi:plastocyanin
MEKRTLMIEFTIVVIIVVATVFFAKLHRPLEVVYEAPPPMTETMKAVLATSKGFQHLVSYTNNGFEPSKLTIKAGETVRFTNNSSGNLRVTALAWDGKIYPGNGQCSRSKLDSCVSLQPQEFWEFTFDAAGAWGFANNGDQKHIGVMTVQ